MRIAYSTFVTPSEVLIVSESLLFLTTSEALSVLYTIFNFNSDTQTISKSIMQTLEA